MLIPGLDLDDSICNYLHLQMGFRIKLVNPAGITEEKKTREACFPSWLAERPAVDRHCSNSRQAEPSA